MDEQVFVCVRVLAFETAPSSEAPLRNMALKCANLMTAPLLASRVFFSHTDPNDLSKVQWTYLGIAAFVFLLAVVFFFSPIPEVTDADMALQAAQCAGLTGYVDKPLRKQYKLFFGVAAQFCYVGAQVRFLTS